MHTNFCVPETAVIQAEEIPAGGGIGTKFNRAAKASRYGRPRDSV